VSGSRPSSRTGKAKRPPSNVSFSSAGSISVVRTALAALVVLAGIAWLVVYVVVAGPDTAGTSLTWMGDLVRSVHSLPFNDLIVASKRL